MVQEVLTSIRVVKAFAREEYEERRLEEESLESVEIALRARSLKAKLSPLVEIIVAVGTSMVLWFGGWEVIHGHLTAGGLTQFVLYMNQLAFPIRQLARVIDSLLDDEHWLFAGTGMKDGDGVPGLVGWEWHGDPADIAGLEVVARGTLKSRNTEGTYTATVYPGPRGNVVFNAATIWWSDGLSAPPGYRRPSAHGAPPPPAIVNATVNRCAAAPRTAWSRPPQL